MTEGILLADDDQTLTASMRTGLQRKLPERPVKR